MKACETFKSMPPFTKTNSDLQTIEVGSHGYKNLNPDLEPSCFFPIPWSRVVRLFSIWARWILVFTHCDLTIEKDKEAAMCGIASVIGHMLGDVLVCGL